jgi:hypothetical protein
MANPALTVNGKSMVLGRTRSSKVSADRLPKDFEIVFNPFQKNAIFPVYKRTTGKNQSHQPAKVTVLDAYTTTQKRNTTNNQGRLALLA